MKVLRMLTFLLMAAANSTISGQISSKHNVIIFVAEPSSHLEIHGHMEAKGNYSQIKNAALILHDQWIFRVSFSDSTYFTAHESINPRNVISD